MKRTVQQKFGKNMLLSLVAIVGLTTFTASAQSPTIYLGVSGGPQYTTIHSNDENFTGGVGYNAGISAEARFSRQFGLEAQFGLSTVSATTSYKDSIQYYGDAMRYNNNYTFNTTWLQGQLFAKYYIRLGGDPITPYDRPEGSGNYLYFLAGGYASFIPSTGNLGHVGRTGTQTTQLHTNNTPWDSGTKTTTTITNTDVEEASDRTVITNFDYGFTLGVGVSLRLSQSASLDFGLRFSDGISSIDNPEPSLETVNPKTNTTPLIANGFFLGHNTLTVTNNQASLPYSPATANNMFIAFNIGLKFKLFGDSY